MLQNEDKKTTPKGKQTKQFSKNLTHMTKICQTVLKIITHILCTLK